jgi:hypothetical protein
MRRIRSLQGLQIALTGKCSRPRWEIAQLIKRKGGKLTGDRAPVTKNTHILVRGGSPLWKHGDFGNKEEKAADLIRSGAHLAVILSDDLDRLLCGKSVNEVQFVGGFDVDDLRAEAELSSQLLVSGSLDATTLSSRRIEQAQLRHLHFGSKKFVECNLCGRKLPRCVLVVGHIKPRAQCSPAERRDLPNVAMPICLLGCDTLYERGFVSVSQSGRIITSKTTARNKGLKEILSILKKRTCSKHSAYSEKYFAWHREYVFSP